MQHFSMGFVDQTSVFEAHCQFWSGLFTFIYLADFFVQSCKSDRLYINHKRASYTHALFDQSVSKLKCAVL